MLERPADHGLHWTRNRLTPRFHGSATIVRRWPGAPPKRPAFSAHRFFTSPQRLKHTYACLRIEEVARSHKWSAVTAVVAMLLPWPAAVILALHEAEDHVTDHVHAGLPAVLHGHEHAAGTPAHDHSLMPSPSMASGHSSAFVATVLRAATVSLSGVPLRPPTIGRTAPSETASPPAGSRPPESVLRI